MGARTQKTVEQELIKLTILKKREEKQPSLHVCRETGNLIFI